MTVFFPRSGKPRNHPATFTQHMENPKSVSRFILAMLAAIIVGTAAGLIWFG
jgi:hypothetical protein